VVFRDCEVTLVRGDFAVSGNHVDDLLVERCHVHDNPGHTKGVAIHTCAKAIVRDCRVVRTTSTAVILYLSTDCQIIGNTVLENYGMHANGLSFYTQCRNILVERNRVAYGNIALTFEASTDLIFRNNLFDGSGNSMVVGAWISPGTGRTIKNVQFLNNTMIRSNRGLGYTVGLFTNCKDVEGLVVRNNIIDGVGDDRKGVFAKGGVFSNNLYTRVNDQLQDPKLGTDCLQELDLKRIFVDPEHDDFRLCARSPAIGAGMEVGVATDIEGKIRPTTRRPDVGAWAYPEGQ
jgi:polygalacturonase